MISFREGRHILAGTPATLNSLLSLHQLQPITKTALRIARERFSELMGLPGRFSAFVTIFPDQAGSVRRLVQGNKSILEVPISHFSHSGKIQDTILLTEHLADASIAKQMAYIYRSDAKLPFIPISCELRCGGGSNLGVTIAQLSAAQDRLCVVIVDSDKKSPKGACGNTLKSVRREHKKAGPSPLIELCVLDCKEMENALPDGFYADAYGADVNHQEGPTFLKNLSNNGAEDLRDFVDIKEGLSLKGIFSLSRGSPDFNFWHSNVGTLAQSTPFAGQHDPNCLRLQSCQNPGACRCWFVKPNNTDILGKASAVFGRWRPDQWACLNGRQKEIWLKVGRVVFEWSSGWTFYAS
ncbi:MAG: hypothetical protein ABSF60_14075 [Verrucomicrobiota bacterium]